MRANIPIVYFKTLVQQHQFLGAAMPQHQTFSILRFEHLTKIAEEQRLKLISDFYQIIFKKNCGCKIQYGQKQYAFDEGAMSFFSPRQVIIVEPGGWLPSEGWLLLVHPDFLRCFPIGRKIKTYGFFEYEADEPLTLFDEEEHAVQCIFEQIEKEYQLPVDNFSQDVVISNIELLLNYSNRYYNRQFISRKRKSNVLLHKTENILNDYFENKITEKGLPTVIFLASELNLSAKHLSDCLKQLTGQTAQQIIHEKVIECAKDKLTTTELSVNEVAYQLGFEYSQSFSRFFKIKTRQTPLEFRAMYG